MGSSEASGVGGGSNVGVMMEMHAAGKAPLRELSQSAESEGGMVVQFVSLMPSPTCSTRYAQARLLSRCLPGATQGIDVSIESLQLNFSDPNVTPSNLASRIPSDKPSYTLYHYPSTSSVIFVYTFPPSSKVKEHMVYSTSKRSVLEVARVEGVDVAKKIEVGRLEEVTADMLREEAQPRVEGAAAGQECDIHKWPFPIDQASLIPYLWFCSASRFGVETVHTLEHGRVVLPAALGNGVAGT
jgi:hypothetical protein